jgi:hypothetical protein
MRYELMSYFRFVETEGFSRFPHDKDTAADAHHFVLSSGKSRPDAFRHRAVLRQFSRVEALVHGAVVKPVGRRRARMPRLYLTFKI